MATRTARKSGKRRHPRATPRNGQAQCTAEPSALIDACVLHDACAFLRKKKIAVPAELAAAAALAAQPLPSLPVASTSGTRISAHASATRRIKWVQSQLGGMKERQKRGLARFVEQGLRRRCAPASATTVAAKQGPTHSDSDDEAGINTGGGTPVAVRGGQWPCGVSYSNDYKWQDTVPAALIAMYRPSRGAVRRRPDRASPRCYAMRITDPDHPACDQNGLYAAVDLQCGDWVLDYSGIVSVRSEADAASEYACEFGEQGELTLDATQWGNEARFINDYRNTGQAKNVEFRTRRDRRGELRQGVYVTAKQGVRAGDELLISYGQGFWRAKTNGSMDEFVYRYVGQPPQPKKRPRTTPSELTNDAAAAAVAAATTASADATAAVTS